MKVTNLDELKIFAQENGYDNANYLCEWNGYSCYAPYFENPKLRYMGQPLLILVDDEGKMRMSTQEEAFAQIDEMYGSEDEE